MKHLQKCERNRACELIYITRLICKSFIHKGALTQLPLPQEDEMTLHEYEEQGGCEGCLFYRTTDIDGRKGCTFEWLDDKSEDWDYAKNCDEISE